ncbi:MAG: inactive transglutaminase family protein [Acidiferrobacterales bacterium]|jgi:hypothetical protein|nr:inactive transglutaminase family protein [Acidiferrobacterales bacterium]
MNNRPVYVIATIFVLAGLGLFLYKWLVLEYPLLPKARAEIWNVEAHVLFQGKGVPAKLELIAPKKTRRYVIVDEAFISRGYGLNTRFKANNRQAIWTTRKASGRQDVYYRASVRFVKRSDSAESERERPIPDKPGFGEADAHAANALIDQVRSQSSDVSSFVTQLFQYLNSDKPDQNVALLLGKNPGRLKRIGTAVDILNAADIPARMVHGVVLDEYRKNAPLIQWLQVYDHGIWRSIDPAAGEVGIPDNYFTWWRGTDPIIRLTGGDNAVVTVSISRSDQSALRSFVEGNAMEIEGASRFSLLSLPIETQLVYRILLTIPVGALLLVIMRNVIGIKTFGTFMPILIALAFRETQLAWGILLFSLVVALGLGVRFYLERLKLLLVPRLASVLIVVVILMVSLSVVSHALGLERGLSVALFPMVIMTMTIERMSIVWEERGSSEALKQGTGSLLVAALAYLLMTNPLVEHLVFVFSELLFVLLAATLLLGRYSGYRLTELIRFRVLARE